MKYPLAGRRTGAAAFLLAGLCAYPLTASALEYPIGQPQHGGGMEVAAVYLQAIEMDPPGMMRAADQSDIHLEADISALADNANGFAEGSWVPYLHITYSLKKAGGDAAATGLLMPMVASDGPHYGDNVKLSGPGKYELELTVSPPSAAPAGHFGRHTDRETGVSAWFEPFTTRYEFVFAGTGKKGGY